MPQNATNNKVKRFRRMNIGFFNFRVVGSEREEPSFCSTAANSIRFAPRSCEPVPNGSLRLAKHHYLVARVLPRSIPL